MCAYAATAPSVRSGPARHDTDEPAATPPAVPAADLAAMRQTLARLGFQCVAGVSAARFEAADATSVLAASGYLHGVDAETGQFPHAHDSLLRTLASLVQPALDGAAFEEQAPDQENGPYRLVAYLDGKRYQIEVGLHGHRLSIRDSGDGFDTALAAQRYTASLKQSVKQGGGAGLGLFLIRRICERFGWRLHLESSTPQGALAIIDFHA
ncbi:hypothetical protein LL965_02940 [Xanthomonas cassavae CFBP 4642]|uniref:Histidine kinase/HSP90-like ATPase domain-containing protein n=1 Tax=Xanthomonas cassavae CFBP 4642 TaxID=1219375 RepID=A0ABS8HD13_9XANT|nr:ATP-binding protein [Xanthomonas cassavae]MCC4619080.1 hypothetical protein [Xanthomonas cassavae CFBP 4642]